MLSTVFHRPLFLTYELFCMTELGIKIEEGFFKKHSEFLFLKKVLKCLFLEPMNQVNADIELEENKTPW